MSQSNGHRNQRRASEADDATPVDALVQAMRQHNGVGMLSVLAPQVRLSVPPLRIHVEGAQQVAGSILDVIDAFDALTYRVRSRYLAPGEVTDEGVLGGLHVRDLLGAPPTGRLGSVSVRVIAQHDGLQVTGLDVWPDVAAVRGLCDELAQHIDQRHAGPAGAMVTALRASIPDAAAKIVHSSAREAPVQPAAPAAEATVLGRTGRSPGRTDGLKSPLTRRVRRRRAVIAGVLMLASSTALIAWVAHGALLQPGSVTTALITSTPSATLDATSRVVATPPVTPSTSAQPDPVTSTPGTRSFTIVENQVVIPSDLLFATGSSTLTDNARADVQAFIEQLITQKRQGRIDVMGYTDDVGTKPYNLKLSKARAKAVADALRTGLPTGWSVYSKGLGEADPKAPGTSVDARKLNRRVEIKVPPSQQ